jgi:hypothetical protein
VERLQELAVIVTRLAPARLRRVENLQHQSLLFIVLGDYPLDARARSFGMI